MALAKPTFAVTVEDIGTFQFRRRTIGDEIAIMARYDAMLGGVSNPSPYLDSLATAVATYQVIATAWPEGWEPASVAQMDAVMDDRIADLQRVFGALSLREDEFRPVGQRRFKAPGQGGSANAGGVVPAEIQPATD